MGDLTEQGTASPAVSGSRSWERALDDRQTAAAVNFLEGIAATDAIQHAARLAVARMRLSRGYRVVDVGCGAGAFFPALSDPLGSEGLLTGIDHSDGLLRQAGRAAAETRLLPRLRLVRADAHQLPFPDGSFDAAHTERVLMHVADPARAMAELRRVVRPGGWITCVEPDLAGIRLDLPDQNWVRGLLGGFLASIRNPGIGLALHRLMGGAGLVERTIDPVTEVETSYHPDVAEIYAEAANTAVGMGLLARDQADRALDALDDAERLGRYTSYATMLVAAGRVPEGDSERTLSG